MGKSSHFPGLTFLIGKMKEGKESTVKAGIKVPRSFFNFNLIKKFRHEVLSGIEFLDSSDLPL